MRPGQPERAVGSGRFLREVLVSRVGLFCPFPRARYRSLHLLFEAVSPFASAGFGFVCCGGLARGVSVCDRYVLVPYRGFINT